LDSGFVLQLLVNGIVIGVIYALLATGLSLVFGVLEIVNFAHGEFYMIGAMVSYFIIGTLHLGYWPMIILVPLIMACVGFVFYEALLAGMRGKNFERSILLTLGVSMVLQNGVLYLWSATPRMITTAYTYQSLTFGEVQVPLLRAIALVIAAFAFSGLYFVLYRTRKGKAMRGVAQNREAALMVGIDPHTVSRLAVVIGIGLAGVAGAALAPIYSVHATMGFAFVFKAFAIIIIGGLGNVTGAALAAIMIGILESFVGGFLPLALVDAMAFVFMIMILLFKPEGLFGRGVRV
jgi:branched-chain amino acid transport system permease protein